MRAGHRCLGVRRPGLEFDDLPLPDVPPPDALDPLPPGPVSVPIRDRYQTRPAFGGRLFEPGAEALTGGWIRADGDTPVDHVLVAALTDGWLPAVFARADVPVGVPTIDLTIHFREQPPAEPGWCLVRFRSNLAADGYIEEDGEVWSADGRLLAQSRQLAVLLPLAERLCCWRSPATQAAAFAPPPGGSVAGPSRQRHLGETLGAQ